MNILLRAEKLKVNGKTFRQQDGVILVEAAIVSMMLALLSFGAVEYGLLFHQADNTASLVRSGARAGTNPVQPPPGDAEILDAMDGGNHKLGNDIERVVIYDATHNAGKPPPACLTNAIPNVCNSYSPSDFGKSDSQLQGQTNGSGYTQSMRTPGSYLGVYVSAHHQFVTGLFGSGLSYNDYAIMRIEAPKTTPGNSLNSDWTSGATQMIPPNQIPYVPGVQDCWSCSGSGGNGGGGL